jgi:hypothetical protein
VPTESQPRSAHGSDFRPVAVRFCRKHTQDFEIMGGRGMYHDGWMTSAFGPSSR